MGCEQCSCSTMLPVISEDTAVKMLVCNSSEDEPVERYVIGKALFDGYIAVSKQYEQKFRMGGCFATSIWNNAKSLPTRISNQEQALQWAKANPDIIVKLTTLGETKEAPSWSYYTVSCDLSNYHVLTSYNPNVWIPITDLEIEAI